jgi:hypothetical protein
MSTELEERLTTSLARSADEIRLTPNEAKGFAQAVRFRRKRRGGRTLIAGVAAIAMVGGGISTYKAATDDPPVQVAVAESAELWLTPSWLPDGVSVTLNDELPSSSQLGKSWSYIWARGNERLFISSFHPETGWQELRTLADALAARRPGQSDGYLMWTEGSVNLSLSMPRGSSPEQTERVARSIKLDEEGKVVVPSVATNLPLIFGDSSELLKDQGAWTMYDAKAEPPVLIRATRPSPKVKELQLRDRSTQGVPQTVRGKEGRLLTEPSPDANKTASVVSWDENGWQLSVSAPSKEVALRIAEGLRSVTEEEWDAFPRTGPPTIRQRRRATTEAAAIEVGSGALVAKAGEVFTPEGCVNIQLLGTDREDKFCLPVTNDPVLWSGIRTIGGKSTVVAIVSLKVDAVTLNTTNQATTDIVSSLSIDDVTPIGVSVDVDEKGERYKWIGFVAIPFDGPAPGYLEALFDTEFDREAPSAEVDLEADTPEPEDTDVDHDALLKSLGVFPIKP